MSKNKTVISNAPMINSTRVWTLKKKKKEVSFIDRDRKTSNQNTFLPAIFPTTCKTDL